MARNIIELKNVAKYYHVGESVVKAVDHINIKIEVGDFVAIMGPSGSGKSTTMNLTGSLDYATDGKIFLDGENIENLTESELAQVRGQKIGFIFQQFNLIPNLTAKENIMLPMLFQNKNLEEREIRAEELLKMVELGDRMNHYPNQLSGGQQQRVAVARALAPKPKFILADEPTANLDSKSAETLLDIMEKLNHEENTTFIFSTHDPRVVAKAHRVITLEDGKIVSEIIKE